jgi:hypothetical protein
VIPTHPRKEKRHRASKPLKVTPPLGQGSYIFPVVGPSGYVDTYGAFRSDVSGKWHHGDDIFAPLGTPVVAVADGTISGVGWDQVGGWRIWLQDAASNRFYYAHLSGYAPSDFHSNRVKAGEVIGFIGNTGHAFTGAPHLHFEVHPHQLLSLGYDGAVDPTTYLDGWRHLKSVDAPVPVHPRLPLPPLLHSEARYVFRELLAARHLINQPLIALGGRPEIDAPNSLSAVALPPQPLVVRKEPATPKTTAGSSMSAVPLLAGLLSVALFVATIVLATRVLARRVTPNSE